jgi:hypothetical protein
MGDSTAVIIETIKGLIYFVLEWYACCLCSDKCCKSKEDLSEWKNNLAIMCVCWGMLVHFRVSLLNTVSLFHKGFIFIHCDLGLVQ